MDAKVCLPVWIQQAKLNHERKSKLQTISTSKQQDKIGCKMPKVEARNKQ